MYRILLILFVALMCTTADAKKIQTKAASNAKAVASFTPRPEGYIAIWTRTHFIRLTTAEPVKDDTTYFAIQKAVASCVEQKVYTVRISTATEPKARSLTHEQNKATLEASAAEACATARAQEIGVHPLQAKATPL
jgi:hypothetical protein